MYLKMQNAVFKLFLCRRRGFAWRLGRKKQDNLHLQPVKDASLQDAGGTGVYSVLPSDSSLTGRKGTKVF
jgi:hypothetical protein